MVYTRFFLHTSVWGAAGRETQHGSPCHLQISGNSPGVPGCLQMCAMQDPTEVHLTSLALKQNQMHWDRGGRKAGRTTLQDISFIAHDSKGDVRNKSPLTVSLRLLSGAGHRLLSYCLLDLWS